MRSWLQRESSSAFEPMSTGKRAYTASATLDAERWAGQTMIWTERQRGRPLYWPAGGPWFANDPLGPHPHTHPDASEIYFVAAGTLNLTVGRQELVMSPGDFCLIPPDTYHHPRNDGATDLGLFVIVAPNWRDRRWKRDDFSEADFRGAATLARTDVLGDLPGDLNIDSSVIAGSTESFCDPGREHVIYVLEGELDVKVDHLAGRLARHDYVHIPAGANHAVRRCGRDSARILSIWTPA